MLIRIPNCDEYGIKSEKLIPLSEVGEIEVFHDNDDPAKEVTHVRLTVGAAYGRAKQYSVYGPEAVALHSALCRRTVTHQTPDEAMLRLFAGAKIDRRMPESQVVLLSGEQAVKVQLPDAPGHPMPEMNTPVNLMTSAAHCVRNRVGDGIEAHEAELAERLGHPVAGTYRHFKGAHYEVHGLARNVTNLHKDGPFQVVYSQVGCGHLYVRDEDEFFDKTGLGEVRFTWEGET